MLTADPTETSRVEMMVLAGIPLAAGLGIALYVLSPALTLSEFLLYVALSISFFAVEVVPLPMPRGASFRLVGGVAVAALLVSDTELALSAYLTGGAAALLIEGSPRMRIHASNMFRRALTMVAVSVAYHAVAPADSLDARSLAAMAPALSAGGLYILADVTGWAVTNERSAGASGIRSIRSLIGLFGGVYLGQVSVGVVLAVVYPSLGMVAFFVLVVLMLIMQHTFGLLLRVRTAYTRTVSALSRVAEMSEDGNTGHGERVASLSAEIGRRLGLESATIERLTLASLVHEIGLVSMDEDDPDREDKRTVALAGADLLSRVSFLAGLSPVVRSHAAPHREYIDTRETDGLLARVIHVACDFDHAVGHPSVVERVRDTLETMRAASGGEYDPVVLRALEDSIPLGEE